MNIAVQYRDRVDTSLFMPRVNWRRTRNDRRVPAVDATDAVRDHAVVRLAAP